MLQKKQFKYYAIRVSDNIVFRKTANTLRRVKSVLYKISTDFRLVQISYTGGRIVGCMSYANWRECGGKPLAMGNCLRIDRELYRSLDPYITKEKVVKTIPTEI